MATENYIRFCVSNVFFLVAFSTIFYRTNSQSCINPRNESGTCVLYHQCSELLQMVNNKNRPTEETKFLKKSICGTEDWTVKLCCPVRNPSSTSCTNPNGAKGVCKPLNQCASLQSLLVQPMSTNVVNFLKMSACKEVQLSVCCSDAPPIIDRSDIDAIDTVKPPHPDIDNLLPADCGEETYTDRIIGGNETGIDQYPWMALIEYENKDMSRSFSCGGSLISKRYVLTAAHCVKGVVVRQVGNPISVRLGEYDIANPGKDCVLVAISKLDCTEEPIDIGIEKIIHHPQYEMKKFGSKHDIALLRLVNEVNFSFYVAPICLPKTDLTVNPPKNFTLVAAGWGTTEYGAGSDKKKHVILPFAALESCGVHYSKYKITLWDKQLCAGGEEGKDSCRGDSGGPLMYSKDFTYTLIGVVSFGPTPCAKPGEIEP